MSNEVNELPTQEEVNKYLISLRDSGATNMLGAAPYIKVIFEVTTKQANDYLKGYIKSLEKVPTKMVSVGDMLEKM